MTAKTEPAKRPRLIGIEADLCLTHVASRLAEHRPAVDRASSRAAVALILRRSRADDGCEALYILRAEHPDDPWSGHMGLPGGRKEERDADLLETARRETLEEVGIDLQQSGRLIGQLDDVRASARGKQLDLAITPYVFELTADVATRRNEAEVQEIHWIDFARLLDPAAASTVPYRYEGRVYQLPCYRVAERVIWGLTYRMLQIFFGVVGWQPGTAR